MEAVVRNPQDNGKAPAIQFCASKCLHEPLRCRRGTGKEADVDVKNVTVLIGRLVKDMELRYLDSGTPVANFSIAVNRSTRKPDGSFEDTLDGFFDCELLGGQALGATVEFSKGSEICVVGSLLQKKFQSNGRTVSRIEIRVRSISAPVKVAKLDDASAKSEPAPQPA